MPVATILGPIVRAKPLPETHQVPGSHGPHLGLMSQDAHGIPRIAIQQLVILQLLPEPSSGSVGEAVVHIVAAITRAAADDHDVASWKRFLSLLPGFSQLLVP